MKVMRDEIVTVVENRPLTGGHFLLTVDSPLQARAARPGQFAMIRLPGRSDVLLRRPMSIYDVKPGAEAGNGSERGPKLVQFLYKGVGRGTRLMTALRPGDQVEVLAPLGHGFFLEEYLDLARKADEVLHVAGGIGIAALLLPARDLAGAGVRQRLFFGGRTKDDLVGVSDFRPLVDEVMLATEDGSEGHRGFVTAPLAEYLESHRETKFVLLVCGPWAMLKGAAQLANAYGHRSLVSMENRMGCAVGVCLGCSIPVHGEGHGSYERVCTEGPVFWAEHVAW
jgi:dihydroorotate dehydrogenase electron transfer subunit